MKGKSVFWGMVIAGLVMAAATGCTTYTSVNATALLGKNLDSHVSELGSVTETCTWTEKMKLKYLDCVTEAKQQAGYQRAAEVISAYGAELEKLTGEQKDLDYATQISSIIKGFTSVEWNKLATDATMQGNLLTPLKSLAGLFVDAAVKKELYVIITKADPLFQDLRKNVDLDFANRTSALKAVNSQINAVILEDSLSCSHKVANPASPECTDGCDIRWVLACRDFRGMNQGWDGYTKAVFAFVDAHHKLKEGFSAEGALKDPETYKQVLDAVKAVYGANNK
jgi:hypothetical protein